MLHQDHCPKAADARNESCGCDPLRKPAAHTPGPWRAHICPDEVTRRGAAFVTGGNPRELVAHVTFARPMTAEREADTRLIATAPTMADLLQRFADLMDGEQGTVEYCTGMEALRADVEQVLQQHGRGQG